MMWELIYCTQTSCVRECVLHFDLYPDVEPVIPQTCHCFRSLIQADHGNTSPGCATDFYCKTHFLTSFLSNSSINYIFNHYLNHSVLSHQVHHSKSISASFKDAIKMCQTTTGVINPTGHHRATGHHEQTQVKQWALILLWWNTDQHTHRVKLPFVPHVACFPTKLINKFC